MGGAVFSQTAGNALAVWVQSQLGDHYNAGDECCALARGMRLLPLICFYKAADTIEDWRRMKPVLPIWATRLSFAGNESNHFNLQWSAQGARRQKYGRQCTSPQHGGTGSFSDHLVLKHVLQWISQTSCICRPYLWHLLCFCPRSALPLGLIMEKRRAVYSPGSSQEQAHMN